MARKSQKRNLFPCLVAVILVVAIIMGAWNIIDSKSFDSVFGELLIKLGLKDGPSGGGLGNPSGDMLYIHFIDVGQGDAIYLQFPDGKDMLIDAGDRDSEITNGLLSYLDGLGTLSDGLDYLMLTHTDSDHVGGMDDVLLSYDIRCVYMPNVGSKADDPERGYISTRTAYVPFYNAVYAEGAQIVYNEGNLSITGEGYKVDMYCPDAEYYDGIKDSSSSENKNNMSPVVIVEYSGVRTLLSGDLNADTNSTTYAWSERHFIERKGGVNYDCDVIKAGHHGSYGSTGERLLNYVTPEYVVVCVGEGNSYGHPHDDFLQRIQSYSPTLYNNIYRTDLKGSIRMSVGSNGEYSFGFSK